MSGLWQPYRWPVSSPSISPMRHGTGPICCFGLEAQAHPETGIQTDPRGITNVGSTFRSDERYCLNLETSRLVVGDKGLLRQSARRNSEEEETASGYVYCSAKAHARQVFTVETTEEGKQYLACDGIADFILRPGPASSGCLLDDAQPVTRENSVGEDKVSIRLFLADQTQDCELALAEGSGGTSGGKDGQAAHDEMLIELRHVRDIGTTSDPDPSITCSTSGSSPSLAPSKVFVGGADAMVLVQSMNFAAAISPTQSTAYQFQVPNDWSGSTSSKRAVYLRLPFCTQLPSGYPCYNFSGMEQEYVSNSGMVFFQIQNAPMLMNWKAQSLVQVTPGQDTLVGTFDCNGGGDTESDGRQLSWLVRSQNRFLLQYLQPDENRHVDNMGLWVVACDG